jgi:hypothetical protein
MKLASPSLSWMVLLWRATMVASQYWRPQFLPNDSCLSARTFEPGLNIYGNLASATSDALEIPLGCGDTESPSKEDRYASSYPGAWYSFRSLGGRLSIRSVNSPTTGLDLFVYEGSCGATTLQCVTKFFISDADRFFTFQTKLDVTYRILVRARVDNDVGSTPFNLETTPGMYLQREGNDVCSNAEEVGYGSAGMKRGDTTYATSDKTEVSDDCMGGTIDYRLPGLWYKVQGSGGKVGVLVTTGTNMTVYKGACGTTTLQCVAASASESMIFCTDVGTTYHLLLRRRNSFYPIVQVSLFPPQPEDPKNDRCQLAMPITLGQAIRAGQISAAFQTERVPGCSEPNSGHWYTFQGTGGRVTFVSECPKNGRFRASKAVVHVYTGTCGASTLQCVTSFYATACDAAPFTFPTEAGTTYYRRLQKIRPRCKTRNRESPGTKAM